jgi:hypothetical protein
VRVRTTARWVAARPQLIWGMYPRGFKRAIWKGPLSCSSGGTGREGKGREAGVRSPTPATACRPEEDSSSLPLAFSCIKNYRKWRFSPALSVASAQPRRNLDLHDKASLRAGHRQASTASTRLFLRLSPLQFASRNDNVKDYTPPDRAIPDAVGRRGECHRPRVVIERTHGAGGRGC